VSSVSVSRREDHETLNNNSGVIAGVAETAEMDPFGERWSCSFLFPPRQATPVSGSCGKTAR